MQTDAEPSNRNPPEPAKTGSKSIVRQQSQPGTAEPNLYNPQLGVFPTALGLPPAALVRPASQVCLGPIHCTYTVIYGCKLHLVHT